MTAAASVTRVDKFRFGIASDGQALTSSWRAAARKSDFYVGDSRLMGHCKISLHASRWCRFAFAPALAEKFTPEDGVAPDRAKTKWKRPKTPDAGVLHVLSLLFPTDLLAPIGPIPPQTATKRVHWLPPAPPGQALELGFFYTREAPERAMMRFQGVAIPIVTTDLGNGEHVVIAVRMAPFNVAPIAALRARRFQSLSPTADQLSPGERLDDLGAFLVNDPDVDGRLQIVVVGGLSLVRNEEAK